MAGKLQGFRGSSVVAPGSDDGSLSLTLPAQTMNRGDHGNSRAQFSCAVDWIQDKTSDVHNVPVACELLVFFVCAGLGRNESVCVYTDPFGLRRCCSKLRQKKKRRKKLEK